MSPGLSHVLDVGVEVTAPGVSWPSSLSFPLGIPLQRLPCDVVSWLPQGVPDPSPSSAPDLLVSWQLVGMLPQVCIADDVGPAYLEDPSQAAVDEGIHFPNGGLRHGRFQAQMRKEEGWAWGNPTP